jgi:hypothetical protein
MSGDLKDYFFTSSKLIEEIIKNHSEVITSKPKNQLAARIKVSSIIKMRNEILLAKKGV